MHLTESQLDAAARKLCELLNEPPGELYCGMTNLATNRKFIEHIVKKNHKTIAAIIHAVTNTKNDEVSE